MSNISNPDEAELQALHRLQTTGNQDWEVVCGWLRKNLNQLDAKNRRLTDETTLRQSQGASMTLEAILIYIGTASNSLAKIKSGKK